MIQPALPVAYFISLIILFSLKAQCFCSKRLLSPQCSSKACFQAEHKKHWQLDCLQPSYSRPENLPHATVPPLLTQLGRGYEHLGHLSHISQSSPLLTPLQTCCKQKQQRGCYRWLLLLYSSHSWCGDFFHQFLHFWNFVLPSIQNTGSSLPRALKLTIFSPSIILFLFPNL